MNRELERTNNNDESSDEVLNEEEQKKIPKLKAKRSKLSADQKIMVKETCL